MVKLIIAGPRDLNIGLVQLDQYIRTYNLVPTEIVSGGCVGIDRCGEQYAKFANVKCITFNAEWNKHGKAAGPIRNMEMAKYADALLLIWRGDSRGSKNMKECMEKLGKPIYEIIIQKTS